MAFQKEYIGAERKLIYTPLTETVDKKSLDKLLDDVANWLEKKQWQNYLVEDFKYWGFPKAASKMASRPLPEKFVLSTKGTPEIENVLKRYKQELENTRLFRIPILHPWILGTLAGAYIGYLMGSCANLISGLYGGEVAGAIGASLGVVFAVYQNYHGKLPPPIKRIALKRRTERRLKAIKSLHLE
jgi:hypothetical protein